MSSIDPQELSGDRLALLYQLSQTFNSSLDLDEVLNNVMDEVIAAINAERGFVMLREADEELVFQVARGMDQATIEDPEFEISRGVVEQVARESQPVLTVDAQIDERFSKRKSVSDLGLRSILCTPLKYKDDLLGVVYVDNTLRSGVFTDDDLELLTAISSSAAIAIENARLYQLAIEKGRMERELQMAYQVQSSLIPSDIPSVSGWEFAAFWRPARKVAGDYFDFYSGGDDRLGMVIADVADKGMPAALFMAFSRSILRASMQRASAPKDGIAEANDLICTDSVYGMFLTLVYCLFNLDAGEVTYVNAGHNPPLFYRSKKDELIELTRTGIPLGIDEEATYDQESTKLNPGDFILFYTDGVCDAMNSEGQEFGMERVRSVLLDTSQQSAAEILDAVEKAISEYTKTVNQFDDITMLVAKRKGRSK
jgi:sigma-B regulation protein RsbU (phosphoserine phosphatase)